MKIANREFRTLHVDREEDLAAAGEVLDIAISSVLRAAGYSAGTLSTNLLLDVFGCATGVDILRLRREGDVATRIGEGGDELGFSPIPFGEDLCRRCTA